MYLNEFFSIFHLRFDFCSKVCEFYLLETVWNLFYRSFDNFSASKWTVASFVLCWWTIFSNFYYNRQNWERDQKNSQTEEMKSDNQLSCHWTWHENFENFKNVVASTKIVIWTDRRNEQRAFEQCQFSYMYRYYRVCIWRSFTYFINSSKQQNNAWTTAIANTIQP